MTKRRPHLVLDVETSIHPGERVSGPGGDANPYGSSRPVWLGYGARKAQAVKLPEDRKEVTNRTLNMARLVAKDQGIVLVGHNFSFDLHHLFGVEDLSLLDLEFTIWDTQTAEYYLEGQSPESRFASLSTLMEKYGHPVPKDEEVSALFKQGIGADKIPDEQMEPYTRNDIAGTAHVYRQQVARAEAAGQLELIQEMMEAQLLFTVMEQTGLPVNEQVVDEIETGIGSDYARMQQTLTDLVTQNLTDLPKTIKVLGDNQVKTAILGGPYKAKVKVPAGTYKNGKTKYKLTDVRRDIAGQPGAARTAAQVAGFDEQTITRLLQDSTGRAAELLQMVLDFRALKKAKDTYVEGYLRRVDKHGIMRTNYNQTATPTGRVSSSNCNVQNLPKG